MVGSAVRTRGPCAPLLPLSGGAAVLRLVDGAQRIESSGRSGLAEALAARPAVVIVDLADSPVDPGVVAVLQQMHREAAGAGARFAVASLDSRARELLERATWDPALLVYPSIPRPPPWSGGRTIREG